MDVTAAHRFRFEATGTSWQVVTDEPLDPLTRRAVLDLVEDVEATFSRFRGDSLLSRCRDAPQGGRFRFPAHAADLFDLLDELNVATDGAVDPLVGHDLERLGYDARYSFTPATSSTCSSSLPSMASSTSAHGTAGRQAAWGTHVRHHGSDLLTQGPVVLDLGAAAKGHLVDLVCGVLHAAGVDRSVVDASGDLRCTGGAPMRVGLEDPRDAHRVIGVVDLQDRALCASASNRRAWAPGVHHLLDARTGLPVQDVLATWVLADRAAVADGLSTALFVADPRPLAERFDFSWVRLLADGRAQASPDLAGRLFT
ncbi:FAD:protein FMN transferase [Cellulomonas soli]|uniref:FAD:protein FMN transferase n=1 Tax=Cellulomonas soli TaxID=931535 RepID=A0A512P8H2_9CELL|nr:FAD:protein FMN transferase [Cellulomonas soli]NYI57716.1 thiamine biosynthesis lipoprotein [Cellulomonas soli]GEP67497.1 FAD:protein FMN transferase [Cellulomonas soli]